MSGKIPNVNLLFARLILRVSVGLLIYRIIAIDGLCLLPVNPVTYILFAPLVRWLYYFLGHSTAFMNADLTPVIWVATIVPLFGLVGWKRNRWRSICGNRWDRFGLFVLFVASPLIWAHRHNMFVSHEEHLTKNIVEAFGNHTPMVLNHPHHCHSQGERTTTSKWQKAYDVMHYLQNEFHETEILQPNSSHIFKTFDVVPNMQCLSSTILGANHPAVLDSINLQNGKLTLDVYRPETAKKGANIPIIVFVHGGAWAIGGPKNFLTNNQGGGVNNHLLRLGFIVVSVTYRIKCTTASGLDMVQDIDDAVHYVIDHADEWGGDKNRLCLLGISAGAHLSLTMAYSRLLPQVKGVISLYGPTEQRADQLRMLEDGWLYKVRTEIGIYATRWLCKDTDPENCYEKLSPVALATAASPPTLMIQGTHDVLVPHAQAVALQEQLEKYHVPHSLVDLPCSTHNCDVFSSGICSQAARFSIERFLFFIFYK